MSYRLDKNYFDQTQAMTTNKIEDVLLEDENILWQQCPKKSAYIWSRVLTMLPLVLIWLVFDTAFILCAVMFMSLPTIAWIGLAVFFALHLAPVWIWIVGIIKGVAEHKNVHYAITNRRLLVRTGIIPDLKIVEFDSLDSVVCRVGLIDRLLHVGDIYITTKNTKVVLFDIANPYHVSSQLQRIINDVKTDMYYPNALRPDNNSGYNTQYNNEK